MSLFPSLMAVLFILASIGTYLNWIEEIQGLALLAVSFGGLLIWTLLRVKDRFVRLEERRSQIEKALRDNEKRYRIILEKTCEAYIETDLNGFITEWNMQAQQLFGWARHEILGSRLAEKVVPERYRDLMNVGWEKFKATGVMKVANKQLEVTGLCSDGREIPLEISITPIDNGFCAFLRDISKRKSMELELNRALAHAIEASQSKSRFLANMSHEIRTPLNSVIGMLDLLLRSPITVSQREQAQIAFEAAKSLLDVINDILDFSKIEAGKLEMEEIDFDLLQLLESATEIMAQTARDKRIALDSFLSPGCPRMLKGDQVRLRQVLLNLVGNAIKFTDRGYVILRAQADQTHSLLTLTVRDSGIGMPQEAIDRLFQPFEQFDGSITRRWGGTGLGLSISKRLIELMEGEIKVKSDEGNGTEFSIILPLKMSDESFKEDCPPSRLRGTRILCLSGLCDWSRAVAHTVSGWGMEARFASSAQEAIEVLSSQTRENKPIHLVLVDMYLSSLDAFSFVKEVESLPHLNSKMILVSAYSDEKLLRKALQSGFSDVLTRPVKIEHLLHSMVTVLGCDTDSGDLKVPETEPSSVKTTLPVLVAEDNPANRKLISIQLKKLGYSSYCVANGKEAVEAAGRFNYALILMDVTMPEMDGFEASRSIRRSEEGKDSQVPIVAVTALAMKGDREKCLASGMDDYLTKPIIYEELERKLKQWIGRSVRIKDENGKEKSRKEAEEAKLLTLKTGNFDSLKLNTRLPIDLDKLSKIWMNDPAWQELLTVFISELPAQIDLLESYIQQRNAELASDQAHNIKGCCLTFACDPLAGFAQRVEDSAAQEKWDDIEMVLSAMRLGSFQIKAFLVVNGMRKHVRKA